MKKRGQITFFLILGISILFMAGAYFYIKSYYGKSKMTETVEDGFDSRDIIRAYAETCLKSVSDGALFRIGQYGGYINPYGDPDYGEQGIPPDSPRTMFSGDKLPYYVAAFYQNSAIGYKKYIPSLDSIKTRLANSIIVEFDKCFKNNTFNDFDLNISSPVVDYKAINFDFSKTNVKIDVSLNEEDVSIEMDYPINAEKGGNKAEISKFKVTLPLRLKALYESAVLLVEQAKNKQPDEYSLNSGCAIFDKNSVTNVYLKGSDDGPNEVVQFVDFSTYRHHYIKSYIFQFAVRDLSITGRCAG